MKPIYSRTSVPKYDFNKVALHECSACFGMSVLM